MSKNTVWWILSIFLLTASMFHLGRGLRTLGFVESQPTDFSLRWRENTYVFKGVNPYDLSEAMWRKEHNQPADLSQMDKTLSATSIGSGYPPWAFSLGATFIPPIQFSTARLWFCLCNIVGLIILASFAWSQSSGFSPSMRMAFIGTALCANALGTTLGNGQWGIVLLAFCLGTFGFVKKSSPWIAGLSFAFLCIKPTFSFPFASYLLLKRQYKPILVASATLFLATSATTTLTGDAPWTMLNQMLGQSSRWKHISYSLPDLLVNFGINETAAQLLCLVIGLVLAGIITAKIVNPLYCLGICAAIARLFAYHQLYDNILMVFLALALLHFYAKENKKGGLFIYFMVVLGLLITGRFTGEILLQTFHLVGWSAGAIYLFLQTNHQKTANSHY